MLPIKKIIISLSALSLIFTSSNVLAQQRNVKSSCSLHTTAGITNGKCIIRTYIEGDYIMVEVYKSWEKIPDRLRLINTAKCTEWSSYPWETEVNQCLAEIQYAGENDWSFALAGENEINGKKAFNYGSGGSGYHFHYDGPFPRP
ncbi:MAG TPA: hypothetical protein VE956_22930 [Nodularia sp. (in: cyanobacteria)]|nr:hypothetical protein [Nodularia sp. (in: cyanobacteria)]